MSTLDTYRYSIEHAPAGTFWFLTVLALVLGAAALWGAFTFLRRKRVIEDTPTALIRSAPQGYVELQGMAELMDGDPIHAPLSMRPSVWYHYQVEHRENRYTDGRRSSRWVTVDKGRSDELFYLVDTSGRCAIDPEGAAVTPTHRNVWYGTSRVPGRYHESDGTWWARGLGQMGKPYRYVERRIEPGEAIYAVGHFTTHGQTNPGFDREAALGERLREWKQDRETMLKRFDENGDGEIDMQEWEAARAAAAREVDDERERVGGPPPVDVLGRTGNRRRPFVIAAGTEDEIVRRCLYSAAGLVVVGVPLTVAALWSLAVRLGG